MNTQTQQQEEKPRIPTQLENPEGLHQRYYIQKIIQGKLILVDEDAEYFVMRLDKGGSDPEHIKACRIGVNAYADAIEHHLPELAKDLRERYPASTPPTPSPEVIEGEDIDRIIFEIDMQCALLEDVLHGEEGDRIRFIRALIRKLQKQSPTPVEVKEEIFYCKNRHRFIAPACQIQCKECYDATIAVKQHTEEIANKKAEVKEDDKLINHMRNIKLLQAIHSSKRFFVECYPTDIGASFFPNSNMAVKEIELPNFDLYEEKLGYKWVKEDEGRTDSIEEAYNTSIGFKNYKIAELQSQLTSEREWSAKLYEALKEMKMHLHLNEYTSAIHVHVTTLLNEYNQYKDKKQVNHD